MPTIRLPYPPKELFPNWRYSHHWSKSSGKVRMARTLAWGLTAQELGPALRRFEAPARLPIRIQVVPPKRPGRPADDDGIKGACKPYFDGLSDALGIDDKHFALGAVEWLAKDGDGEIVIQF